MCHSGKEKDKSNGGDCLPTDLFDNMELLYADKPANASSRKCGVGIMRHTNNLWVNGWNSKKHSNLKQIDRQKTKKWLKKHKKSSFNRSLPTPLWAFPSPLAIRSPPFHTPQNRPSVPYSCTLTSTTSCMSSADRRRRHMMDRRPMSGIILWQKYTNNRKHIQKSKLPDKGQETRKVYTGDKAEQHWNIWSQEGICHSKRSQPQCLVDMIYSLPRSQKKKKCKKRHKWETKIGVMLLGNTSATISSKHLNAACLASAMTHEYNFHE